MPTTDNTQVSDNPIIATDKISGVDYQRVKVNWGVDGVSVDTSATNPMPVSGEFQLSDGVDTLGFETLGTTKTVPVSITDDDGNPAPFTRPVSNIITPTLSTAAHISGDVLFVATAIPEAANVIGGTGHLLRLTAIDKQDIGVNFDVYVYATNVSTPAVNEPYTGTGAVSLANSAYFIEKFTFSTWEDHGLFRTCTLGTGDGLPLAYYCYGGTSLYIVGVTRGTPTYTTTSSIVLSTLTVAD